MTDIFLVNETKLDSSFPNNQFFLPGFKTIRKDRSKHGGGIAFFINEDIPCRIQHISLDFENTELLSLELRIRNNKILVLCV